MRHECDKQFSHTAEVRMKSHRLTKTFSRKSDAKDWAHEKEKEIKEGRLQSVEAQKRTFAEMIDRYLVEILPTKPKATTQKQQLLFFKARLGNLTLNDVNAPRIRECRDELSTSDTANQMKRTRSPATVNRYLAALSHVYNVAVNEWEWLEKSPMPRVKKLKEPRGRVRFLSDDTTVDGKVLPGERTRLLKACQEVKASKELFPIVVLAISTGMRYGEISNLKWSQVDIERRRITLYETKNGEIRVVPLVAVALDSLKSRAGLKNPERDALVFPSTKNPNMPFDIRSAWLSAVKKAELEDFRFHDLRHSAASYLAMNGATPNEIAEVLGHKTLQMVKRYSHFSEAHTTKVVEDMNKKIFEIHEDQISEEAEPDEKRRYG